MASLYMDIYNSNFGQPDSVLNDSSIPRFGGGRDRVWSLTEKYCCGIRCIDTEGRKPRDGIKLGHLWDIEGARGHSGITGWTPSKAPTPSRGQVRMPACPKSDRESTWDSVDREDSDPSFAVSERKKQNLI